MKKIILYLLLLVTCHAGAQAIVVPDANFMAKLLASGPSNNIAKDSSGDSIAIDADENGIITVAEAEEVRELNVSGSNINSLTGIEYFIDLRVLDCSNNVINGSLSLTSLADIREINCSNNQLTTLLINGLDHLEILDCSTNQLSTLDLTGLGYLESLTCNDNNLSTLDASSNTELVYLSFANNDLVTLFIKNGADEAFDAANWSTNPTLEYICADEFQVATIQGYSSLSATTQVNSYCSYAPGGIYNRITGVVKFDGNNNNYCSDGDDYPIPSLRLKITGGSENYEDEVFTQSDGSFIFYVGLGEYHITPVFENDYFTSSVVAGANFTVVDGAEMVRDICVHKTAANHPDVEVVIVPLTDAQPGMNAIYKMVYKNKGNQTLTSGSVTCLWESERFSYVYAEPLIDVIGTDTYTWNYTGLKPFESREIIMELNVNSPSDTPPVNVGDVLEFGMTINPGTDDMPEDNSFYYDQPVVENLTANTITCVEGNVVSPDAIGEYLHYVVNFENTGTALPDFAVIETDVDTNAFDVTSLRLVNSSQTTSARIANNRVTFRLENFSVSSDGKGNLIYKIKSRNGLTSGTTVTSNAKVFYDYNAPVQTNDANTTFSVLSTGDFEMDNSVKLYPNPSKGIVKIEADTTIKTIYLYDIQGRQLEADFNNEDNAVLDVSGRAEGIYFVKIITEKGMKVEKLIRE
ncbi:T9SS type A sorting domain-containing protein [Flavobacterium suzhouense]|uniref:T9SS type A sorting domain-containing protein n=1 Tax=Flavobacterium suzhouense TaxID=1529638 RepID=A0ABW5NQF8_9FLAO